MPNTILEPEPNKSKSIAPKQIDPVKRAVSAKVKTGVEGLDDVLNGGIPAGNLVVVSGEPGAGKTILCLEYLYRGVAQYNEPGV